MSFDLIQALSGDALAQRQAMSAILSCNQFSSEHGLTLTEEQAAELVETRGVSLRANGRVEFGGGVIDRLIRAFCSSPYLTAQNYAPTLHELTEIFYCCKNETLDQISDDELIRFMAQAYNGPCGGSLELLANRELAELARRLRFGGAGIKADEAGEEGESDES